MIKNSVKCNKYKKKCLLTNHINFKPICLNKVHNFVYDKEFILI